MRDIRDGIGPPWPPWRYPTANVRLAGLGHKVESTADTLALRPPQPLQGVLTM